MARKSTYKELEKRVEATVKESQDYRHKMEMIAEFSEIYNDLGTDTKKNIDIIVKKTCEVLNGACSLYNRLDDQKKSLCAWSGFNLPTDFKRVDTPDGHICYEAAIKGKDETVVLEDLRRTIYWETDPNVKKYALKSYLGAPVFLGGKAIGALSIVDVKNRSFSSIEIQTISTLAKAVSLEEERKRAEDKLQESEKRLHLIADNLPVMIAYVDSDQTYRFVNQQYDKWFGLSPSDIIGRKMKDMMGEDKYKRASDRIEAVLSGKHISEDVIVNIEKIGSWPFRMQYIPHISETGDVMGYFVMAEDIKDRKQAEEALRFSETRLRDLYEGAPVAYLTVDLKGIIGNCNRMAEELSGYGREDLNGKDIMELFAETPDGKDKAESIFERFLQGERIRHERIQISKKEGPLTWGSLTLNGILDEDGNIIASRCILIDISDHVELEAQFLQAQKMEALGTLAGGIAHDFNNLLMGIQGRASLMLIDTDTSHPHFEHLKEVEEYIRSAAGLTEQLLGFARGGKYEVRSTDLNEHIKAQNRMFGRTKKEITVHGTYEEALWRTEVDQGQIGQVLLNIYVNAWQAMPGGGNLYIETKNIMLDKTFANTFQVKPGRYVRISIRDTGVGMDKEIKKRIFDPFFTTKEIGRGTGLGLASVYGIIKNHDGFVDVHSKKGEGSTFNIYLPAIEESSKEQKTKGDTSLEIITGTGTVLLVDDEDMIIDVGEKILKEMGYEVLTARSGKDAIETVRKGNDHAPVPDIVILDMVMPDMNGSEAYERIKEISPDVKILLSSGYSIDENSIEILEQGCDGFIQKPFDIIMLSQKIKEILDEG